MRRSPRSSWPSARRWPRGCAAPTRARPRPSRRRHRPCVASERRADGKTEHGQGAEPGAAPGDGAGPGRRRHRRGRRRRRRRLPRDRGPPSKIWWQAGDRQPARRVGHHRHVGRDGPLWAQARLRDPVPVIFFEHKALYHAAKEDVPDEIEALPLGHADVVREGRDLTIIAYGAMVRVAREAAETLASEDGAECEVIDLLTVSPLDRETIVASVQKTGRALIVHEAPKSFGPGAEIAASIVEGAFLSLEAPI